MSAFNQHCSSIVKDYVQTVLIIDDGAGLNSQSNGAIAEVLDDLPERNPLIAQTPDDDIEEDALESDGEYSEESVGSSHPLNALELTNAFYQNGIVAGLYQPQITDGEDVEEFAEKTEKVASTADIIVLDWMLKGSDASYSKAIVKKITEFDRKSGGRIRNIIIYTGETNLIALKDSLFQALGDDDIDNSDDFQLSSQNLKISFYNKPGSGGRVDRELLEQNLPVKALEEFEALVDGLVPAFAMKAAATIRHNTGRIIAKFDKSLDIGYIGHRALLPSPQDSEVFMLENFVSYLRNILAISKVDNESLGDDILERWIQKKYPSLYSTFSSGEGKNLKELIFDKNSLCNILKYGTNQESLGLYNQIKKSYRKVIKTKNPTTTCKQATEQAKKFAYNVVNDNKKPLAYLKLFSSDDNCIELSSKKFSILCSFKRTYKDLNLKVEKPYLTQGSLVFDTEDNSYYLCITPKCDTARVYGERQFSFAKMQQVEENRKFDLVAPRNLNDFIYLSCETNFYNLKHLTFDGGEPHRIIGTENDNSIIFNSKEGATLTWIGDLNDLSTQKRVSDLVGNFNRIGVDEVEWLRRK
jgi:hypothetical protein